ncbi:heme o synthase [Kangiella sediminilitoris]|uniref:Protoheme IX farnesyltransferase n=1 Tax=Kangiella sediminilitoris TaxID=1144748 RepID=A0A1B3B893_9GAMM|nr:heme o synthase [Kangiella sediminilitoris]AOE49000.1 Protoheme IX farnesyltransferase [Kangiella sediminilitoris]
MSAETKYRNPRPITWRDYYELTKPKVVYLLVFTAVVGMFLANDVTQNWFPPLNALIFGTIGIALASGAAAVVNHVVDARIDTMMARTQQRPVAQGRVSSGKAIAFSAVLATIAMVMLWFLVNPLTAILTLGGLVGYAFIYTMFLKRATPQNIVIGGLSGAIPPLLGWTSVTGSADPHAWLLVLIIFTWTPPHFWALSIHRIEDYAKAEIPMLPVTHGEDFTKTSIVLYTVLLILSTLLPYLTHMSGIIYLIGAVALGIWFLYYTMVLKYREKEGIAMKTFGVSIGYLTILFAVLLIDHYVDPFI